MLASVRPCSYLEFIAGGDLSLVCPQRREPTVKCCDQAVEVALSGFQRANLGSQPRHRPKPDNLVAFHAGSQLYAASQQVARDLLALVGKDPRKYAACEASAARAGPTLRSPTATVAI